MVRGIEFQVSVRKQEVMAADVIPLMQEQWLPMSNLDLLLPPFDYGVFICYKKPTSSSTSISNSNSNSMIEVLKKALVQALVSFYAFAGEVVTNSTGEPPVLLCNNRGVDFIEAFADVELKHLNLYEAERSIHGKLLPKKKLGHVLAVQVHKLCVCIYIHAMHHQLRTCILYT